jgi:iron(III) transport system substrate-binding protein
MQANNPVVFDGNTPIVRAVGEGEISVGLVNHYYLHNIQREENYSLPIANHYFAGEDVGSLINVAGAGIIDSAGNPDDALRLIEFLVGEEGQTYFTQVTSEYPVNDSVDPIDDLVPLSEIGSPDIDLNALDDLERTLQLLTEVGLI